MRDIIKYGLTLMVITVVSSGILSFVYEATEEKRKDILEREKQEALAEVLPASAVFEERDGYWAGYLSDARDEVAGYAFIAKGAGYSASIETMVGITTDGKISGIKVLSQQETPGLGARVEEIPPARTLAGIILRRDEKKAEGPPVPWFQKQFIGRRYGELTPENLQAITGATITTEAVMNSVREGIKELLEKVRETEKSI